MAKAEGAKPKAKPTGKKAPSVNGKMSQRDRFIEAALGAGVDETGASFEEAFARIVPARKR